MESKVFADITFLTNFVMDFIILWATGKIAQVEIVIQRLFWAALLGGIYASGSLFSGLDYLYSLPVKILFSSLLVVLAFWPVGLEKFKKCFLCFYAVSFTAAGATIALSFLVHSSFPQGSMSYFWLMGGIGCVLLVGYYGDKYFSAQIIPSLIKCQVQLRFDNLFCQGEGFLDTGNGLRDPLTRRPVVVAEYSLLKDCIPDDFQSALENFTDDNDGLAALCKGSWANRLRVIPFSSIGKKNGLLIGLRSDEVIIRLGKRKLLHKNLVVGIYQHQLSAEGDYQMLIPSEILQ